MREYEICECTPLEDTLIRCAPVLLFRSISAEIFIGSSGAFVLAGKVADPGELYAFLRDFFCTSRVALYLADAGLYDAVNDRIGPPLCDEELTDAIYMHATLNAPVWNEEDLAKVQQRIRLLDGRNRGLYRDSFGNWFIAQNDRFYFLSPHDPDRILRLALFGGVLGLHRFAMGKRGTGVLYALTGGLMGFGWLLDVFQLASGTMRDGKKGLIPKPEHTGLLWYVGGFAAGAALFGCYTLFSEQFAFALDQVTRQSVHNVDADALSGLKNLFGRFGE